MDVFESMRIAVLEGEEEEAVILANRVLDEKLDLVEAMNKGFLQGIKEAGDKYQSGEYYLPELVCSADAMKAALEILAPELRNNSSEVTSKGLIVIATVQGDVHDIGKLIVAAMLTAAGYDICDLGADVPNEKIIETVKELKPQVLGMSALLTTTMEEQKNVIELLEQENIRDGLKVIVGGAPVNSRWAEQIHADGYSDNAIDAVKLVSKLLSSKPPLD